MNKLKNYQVKGNYQDMAWLLIEGQEGAWLVLRDNIVLDVNIAQEEIRLQAVLTIDEASSQKGYCQGNIEINLHWREGLIEEVFVSKDKEEEGLIRKDFLSEPLDGGKKALSKQPKPFGASRNPGFIWKGEPILRCKDGWRINNIDLHWQAGLQPDLEICNAELVCLHAVRTGLRTVILEALIKVPYKTELFEHWPGQIWLKQEEIIIDLEDDAVMEVLGVSFQDDMLQMGFNRDARCLQMHWLCQVTIFYLRAPSGGGRIGVTTISQTKSAFLPAIAELKEGLPNFRPGRRDVVVRIHKPERLLCRYGLFLKVGKEIVG